MGHREYYQKNKDRILLDRKEKYRKNHDFKKRGYTEEQFQNKLRNIHGNKYTTLENYINSEQKIKVKCTICNLEWSVRTSHLLGGSGCPICGVNKKRKTKEQFEKELKKIHCNKYELIGDYINAQKKVSIKCKICDNIWTVKPTHLISSKSQCPVCSNKKRSLDQRKSEHQFILDFNEIHNGKYSVIGTYINVKTPIEIKCNKCNIIWKSIPNSLLMGNGCPHCNQSKGEEDIENFLKKNKITYIYQYKNGCRDKYILHFDFAVFNKNNELFGLIEYDGFQHYRPVDYFGGNDSLLDTKRKDNIKNKYCEENSILLLRIPYTKRKNIEEIISEWLLKQQTSCVVPSCV